MKRVVVTGMGVVSCLGLDKDEVAQSLRDGQSGIRFNQEFADLGFRSQVSGHIEIDLKSLIDRKARRFMGAAAAMAFVSMDQAVADSGLQEQQMTSERTGLIMGSGGTSCESQLESADIIRNKGVKRIGPYRVTQIMGSTVSACLATPFQIKGVNYSISSACATSSHCIGNAMEMIQHGKQDIVFAGGGEELHWNMAGAFDAMGALSVKRNDKPATASRTYDADRDGFVIAHGAGCLVLEELEHALRRNAPIYAELTGYGFSSDGADMVAPSGEGAVRCMKMALDGTERPVQYINTHGTSTPAGDMVELEAIRQVFGDAVPPISSTKSLSGHSLGAAGVHEAIYTLLMMKHDFISASANIDNLDEAAKGYPIVQSRRDGPLDVAMSNSFGFGGTNACLVFSRYQG